MLLEGNKISKSYNKIDVLNNIDISVSSGEIVSIVGRPSYVLGGRAMEIVYEQDELERYIKEAVNVEPDHPILIDQYLENAIEVDVDALCDVSKNVVIGAWYTGGDPFDGYMSYVAFIDGTQELPTIFGETDATTGEWKIKTTITPSSAWGTNGYLILKDGNTITDQSSNSNNWTSNGAGITKSEDNPSNVFATWASTYWIAATFANGNTGITTQGSSNYAFNPATLGINKGKFYWENKITSTTTDMFGISGRYEAGDVQNELGQFADQYAFVSTSGAVHNNDSDTSFTSAFNTNGNIVQIAFDCDNLKLYLGVNGTWQNSGVPTSGSTGTGAVSVGALSTTKDGFYFPAIGDWSSGSGSYETNFGNGYFGTTAVASAGTNASGNGIFEYDVPTGYTALSTKGLNL